MGDFDRRPVKCASDSLMDVAAGEWVVVVFAMKREVKVDVGGGRGCWEFFDVQAKPQTRIEPVAEPGLWLDYSSLLSLLSFVW